MQILGTPAPANGSLLRSAPSSHVLTLIAGKEGKQSQALIAMRSSANDKFTDSEDAELLLDSNLDDVPTIYTVAGTQTVSINVRKNLVHIPGCHCLGRFLGQLFIKARQGQIFRLIACFRLRLHQLLVGLLQLGNLGLHIR